MTLRNRTGAVGVADYFGADRSGLKAGHCVVAATDLSLLTPLAEVAPIHIADEILSLSAIEEQAGRKFLDEFQRGTGGRRPLLYTHGFNESFARSCQRATLLKENLRLDGRLLLFAWPSDGSILNYTQDESDLYWSVLPLEDIIAELVDRFGRGQIDLAGHSLGARGMLLALTSLSRANDGLGPLVNDVILIAPDIDFGLFQQYLPRIRPIARNITIYVSNNDRPLALSSQLHGYPRLGEAGNDFASLEGVEVIDLSDVPVRSVSGHVYHLYSTAVIDDLSQLVNDDLPAVERAGLQQTGDNQWRMTPRGASD